MPEKRNCMPEKRSCMPKKNVCMPNLKKAQPKNKIFIVLHAETMPKVSFSERSQSRHANFFLGMQVFFWNAKIFFGSAKYYTQLQFVIKYLVVVVL
jgi:hypothetical protein